MSTVSSNESLQVEDELAENRLETLTSTTRSHSDVAPSNTHTSNRNVLNFDVLHTANGPNFEDQVLDDHNGRSLRHTTEQISDNAEINNDSRSQSEMRFKDQVSNAEETGQNSNLTTRTQANKSRGNNEGQGHIGAIHIRPSFTSGDVMDDGNGGDDNLGGNYSESNAERSGNSNETVDSATPFVPNAVLVEQDKSVIFAEAHPVSPVQVSEPIQPVNKNALLRWIIKHPILTAGLLFLLVVLITGSVFIYNKFRPPISTLSPTMTPSATPSFQPSMTLMSTICFEQRDELQSAIQEYLLNNETVRNTYGDRVGLWCVSHVQDFSYLFADMMFNEDISRWNTSSATTMEGMFLRSLDFNQDISRWDVSSVTNMAQMFKSAFSFNQNLSEWNVSKVSSMSSMFTGAVNFKGNISSWDTSSVKNMSFMFRGATVFNGDLSAWDVSSVTTLESTFRDAKNFDSDLSLWNTKSVSSLSSTFRYADNFDGDISLWDTSSVTDMAFIFYRAILFNSNISAWDVSHVRTFEGMFMGANSFNGDISMWNTSSAAFMSGMFQNTELFNADISLWKVSSVLFMNNMFWNAQAFNQDISNWNLSSVIDMRSMFEDAISFSYSLCNWGNTISKITNVDDLFHNAASCPNTSIATNLQSDPPGPFCHTCP